MSFLFYIVFSLCCVYACCDEPFGCSQSFTFVEKTLDKVIRTEVKVETIEQRIIETNTAVKTALEDLKREREEIKKEKNDFEAFFENQTLELKRQREETRIYLENQRNRNEEKMTEFFNKKTLTTPTVLFKARTLSDKSVQTGQVLIFTKNMLNYGDGYDNKTGVFTASVSGTYLFTFQLCVSGGKDMYYGLLHNGNVHTAGNFYDRNIGSCYTADGMLYLEVGDTVSIKCLHSSAVLFETTTSSYSADVWNTFSGMLVHQ